MDDGIPVGEDGVIVVDVQLLQIRVPVQIIVLIPHDTQLSMSAKEVLTYFL